MNKVNSTCLMFIAFVVMLILIAVFVNPWIAGATLLCVVLMFVFLIEDVKYEKK